MNLPFGKIIAKMAIAGIQEAAENEGKSVKCEASEDCANLGLGLRCSCGKILCASHLYFQMNTKTMKPQAICPSCVVDNHPEIFDNHD
jgi:hypothetical protein